MKRSLFIVLLSFLKHSLYAALLTCSPEPIASSTPLDSVLDTWPKSYMEYVENRPRISMCTGVIWIGSTQLVSVGVHNHSVDTYRFEPETPLLYAYKTTYLDLLQSGRVGQLENLAVLEDRSLAAVVNNGTAFVHLYHIVNEEFIHVAEIPKKGWWAHGVRFSRHGDYLAYTLFGKPGQIRLFHLTKSANQITMTPAQEMVTPMAILHPKGVDFSPDDRFLVICHAINNSYIPNQLSGAITVHRFDHLEGRIDPVPISSIGMSELLCVPEDLCFAPDGTSLLVTNHGNDTVTIHAFDLETGQLGESKVLLQNPDARLTFPHGLSISPDGKYLAVTNYGDDTVKIYALSQPEE